jgi:hypothetical protein
MNLLDDGKYAIRVHNIPGQMVIVLIDKKYAVGQYNITFDISNLSSGIYLYRLNGNGKNLIKKMLLVK